MGICEDKGSFSLVYNWTDYMTIERLKKEKKTMGFRAGKLHPHNKYQMGKTLLAQGQQQQLQDHFEKELSLALRFQEILVNRPAPMMKDLSDLFKEAREYEMPGDTTTTVFNTCALMLNKMASQAPR